MSLVGGPQGGRGWGGQIAVLLTWRRPTDLLEFLFLADGSEATPRLRPLGFSGLAAVYPCGR